MFAISSKVIYKEKRDAVRESWVVQAGRHFPNIGHLFILGKSTSNITQKLVQEEASLHNDILQVEIMDTYRNLTMKTIALYTWFKYHCRGVKWIMKTDDDIFVNWRRLVPHIFGTSSEHSMFGRCYINPTPVIRDPAHRWYVSPKVYRNQTYLNYCCGCGYVTSWPVIADLADAMYNTPVLPLEDVFVGVGKKFVSRNGLQNKTELCRHMKNFFIIHDVDKDDMLYYKQCTL